MYIYTLHTSYICTYCIGKYIVNNGNDCITLECVLQIFGGPKTRITTYWQQCVNIQILVFKYFSDLKL